MLNIHLQQKAKEDLKKIWRDTHQKWGIDKADIYFDELTAKFDILKENPEIGVSCDYIRLGYRQYHANKHLVFYTITKKHIQIIRVLHEKMDFKKHIN